METKDFKRNILIYSAIAIIVFALITWALTDNRFNLAISIRPINFYYKLVSIAFLIIYYTVASLFKSKALSIIVYTIYLSVIGFNLFALIFSLISANFLLALVYLVLIMAFLIVNFYYIISNNQIINNNVQQSGAYFKNWWHSLYQNVLINKPLLISIIVYYVIDSILNNPK
ncbi:MAG: hypothetical protein M3005_05845 [Apilactobacillus sp.]|uniref:hypothetical protein n=1 Tax=Apilactobacillus sp. TaxID=2767901 RepID=UPI0025D79014|nr:hypothetical protein [Apilactobacillus sp.]MCT6823386.1 hypothetical protein [Apilactobacillus sp.]